MRRFLLINTALLLGFTTLGQPKITSFSPASGPIGSTVIINGTGFNPSPVNNFVFFGAVRAVVQSVSSNSLTVTVPLGATYEPITVTTYFFTMYDTAYSGQSFFVTFPGAGSGFDPNSFNAQADFATAVKPYGLSNIDLDGDGKPDLATANYNGNSMSILKNTSTGGNFSYDPHVDYSTGLLSQDVFKGDFNGDGKPDLAVVNWNSNTFSVFRNTSTAGTISFAPKLDFATGTSPNSIAIGDIDGDGHPDVVVTNVNSHDVTIHWNTGYNGSIQFAPPLYFPTGFNPYNVILRDLDGDGKTDMALSVNGANKLAVFRNTSTPNNISFDPRSDINTGPGPFWVTAGDLDLDGKTDLVVTNNQGTTLSVYRNISTFSVILFSPKVDFFTGVFPQHVVIGDLDGDGKPEIALAGNDGFASLASIYKNNSTVGNISFANKVDYVTTGSAYDIKLGDVNADGKPDVITTGRNGNVVSILTNNIAACITITITAQPSNVSTCIGTNAIFSINASNSNSYQWQENTGSGWNNLMNNATYSGCLTNTLTITAVSAGMNNYQYRCVTTNACSNINSNPAVLSVISSGLPSITISTASNVVCAGSAVTFNAATVNGGTAPVFQWKKNGINVGININSYTDNSFATGDIVSCELT